MNLQQSIHVIKDDIGHSNQVLVAVSLTEDIFIKRFLPSWFLIRFYGLAIAHHFLHLHSTIVIHYPQKYPRHFIFKNVLMNQLMIIL